MTTLTAQTTQVYSVFIRATPEQIWDAITKPEFTEQYFFGARIEVRDGRRFAAITDVEWDEEVREEDPPHKLVHGWISAYDSEMAAETESTSPGRSSPRTARSPSSLSSTTSSRARRRRPRASLDGWMYVLSGLKTLLETGKPLAG